MPIVQEGVFAPRVYPRELLRKPQGAPAMVPIRKGVRGPHACSRELPRAWGYVGATDDATKGP